MGCPQPQTIAPAHATAFMRGEPGEEINIPYLPAHATTVAGDVKKVNLAKPTLSMAQSIPKRLFLLPQSADNSYASNDYTSSHFSRFHADRLNWWFITTAIS
jgi:hypothetical protein